MVSPDLIVMNLLFGIVLFPINVIRYGISGPGIMEQTGYFISFISSGLGFAGAIGLIGAFMKA